jgi:DNA replication and repair protein RecF
MVTDIHLVNFRSYTDDSFELSPKVNIIVGPNGSGKTNLLEALLVICRGFSYRSNKDSELLSFGKDWTKLEAHTRDFDRAVKIEKLDDSKTSKTFVINTKSTKRLSIDQAIPVVIFEPNDMLLLTGSPELRRDYLDNILEQTVIGYKTIKNSYKRVLAQRNSLLKNGANQKSLFVWNIRLAELGGKVFSARKNLVDTLRKDIGDIYQSISGGNEKIEIFYLTSCGPQNYETELLHKLESNFHTDLARGFTSHGPHRDDIKLLVNDKAAGEVASRGETRSMVLALKVIEAKLIENIRNVKPIFMFDDVFSELDGARRLALTKLLKDQQVIITTTDADVVVQHFTENTHIIPLGDK